MLTDRQASPGKTTTLMIQKWDVKRNREVRIFLAVPYMTINLGEKRNALLLQRTPLYYSVSRTPTRGARETEHAIGRSAASRLSLNT